MFRQHNRPHIFTPRSMTDLLTTLRQKPEATLYAGGTYILSNTNKKCPGLPDDIIHLKDVEDLARIHRTERFIEVGACTTVGKILSIGHNVLPPILYSALISIGTPALRNLATLGGNLCVPNHRMTTFPVLILLDARIELRKSGSSRWIGVNRFATADGELDLSDDEIVSRIRIPLKEWDVQIFKRLKTDPYQTEHSFSFSGLANNSKGVLTDFRFAIGTMGKAIIRSREIEAALVSRKLPLPERDSASAVETFGNLMESMTTTLSRYQRKMAFNLFRWFLSHLENDT